MAKFFALFCLVSSAFARDANNYGGLGLGGGSGARYGLGGYSSLGGIDPRSVIYTPIIGSLAGYGPGVGSTGINNQFIPLEAPIQQNDLGGAPAEFIPVVAYPHHHHQHRHPRQQAGLNGEGINRRGEVEATNEIDQGQYGGVGGGLFGYGAPIYGDLGGYNRFIAPVSYIPGGGYYGGVLPYSGYPQGPIVSGYVGNQNQPQSYVVPENYYYGGYYPAQAGNRQAYNLYQQ